MTGFFLQHRTELWVALIRLTGSGVVASHAPVATRFAELRVAERVKDRLPNGADFDIVTETDYPIESGL